ncbi:MAG: hypothetical protein ACRD3C_11035 [Vicinamibacterales bacterium]
MIDRTGCRQSVSRWWGRGLWLLCVLVFAPSASAQSTIATPPPDSQRTLPPETGEPSGRWIPLGPAPADQAGTGGRGYVLPMEDGHVTAARSNQLSVHAVAANYFYREHTSDFLVSQRYETHTLALGYRHGFKVPRVARFEIGGHLQLHQSDSGMLNGFIEGFEGLWASLTGSRSAKNQLRTLAAARPPQGTLIARGGSPIYRDAGTGSGLGDVYLLAKIALRDADPSSRAARLSARAGINVAGSSRFSEGNFVGAGLSIDKKVLEWVAFHGDVRATRALDSMSAWNLPLRRWTYGFSAGSELKLSVNSSFILQIGGSSTPYLPTGTAAFDKGYGDITFGLAHRFTAGSRYVTTKLYARENLNLPFRVRWNTDPDLSVGLTATIH